MRVAPAGGLQAPAIETESRGGLWRKCAACGNQAKSRTTRNARRVTPKAGRSNGEVHPASGRSADGSSWIRGGCWRGAVEVLRSGGMPLSPEARAFFELRFGRDFSGVRIHTHAAAGAAAEAINARAYTFGRDIAFAPCPFAAETREGRRLLARRAVRHVVQQGNPYSLQEYRFSNQGDAPIRHGALSAGVFMDNERLPALPDATNIVRRQTGDPLAGDTGPEKPKSDPATERVNEACGAPCGMFPWVQVAPDRFFILCDDTVKMASPVIQTGGCTPGRLGNVVLVSGSPAWELPIKCDTCTITESGQKPKPAPAIKIGYIQTAEQVLSGGVYFTKDATGKWVWAGNNWVCVSNARDGHATSTAPWYGPDAQGNFGPQPFGACPALIDNPFVRLPSRDAMNAATSPAANRRHIPYLARRASG